MPEIQVVLRDAKTSGKSPPDLPVDVFRDSVVTHQGDAVTWHFVSLEPGVDEARITFQNTGPGGQFFRNRSTDAKPSSHQRQVSLTQGSGDTLGNAPHGKASTCEKYTVAFYKNGAKQGEKDPEIIIGRP